MFLHLLVRLSERMAEAILIFGRGFRRVSFLKELRWLKQPFIVRLAAKVRVVSGPYQGLLSHHPLRPGQLIGLGPCALRQARPVTVRIIGVWALGQDESRHWRDWPPTSPASPSAWPDTMTGGWLWKRNSATAKAVPPWRDLKIKWTTFQDGQALARLFLLAAIAMTVWILAALLALRADPTLRLESKSKGARRSLLAIGIESVEQTGQVLKRSCVSCGLRSTSVTSPGEKSEGRSAGRRRGNGPAAPGYGAGERWRRGGYGQGGRESAGRGRTGALPPWRCARAESAGIS
jgi:hypothetical protein